MTPKEKAEELFIKFYPNWYDNGLVAKRKYAKEYALMAVDLLLEQMFFEDEPIYWQEVKTEIEKL
jgi:hypothetical protein